MGAPRPRIVLVEDDPSLADVLALRLEAAACDVERCGDGAAALAAAQAAQPDLVVLDLGLPGGMDGMAVLQRLRATADVPVLILTARSEPRDRVRGLEAGADDYVGKPCDTEEVLARVRALLRRTGHFPGERLSAGDLHVDRARYTASVRGHDLGLSPREVDLLGVLLQARGRALTRGQLLDRVWGVEAEVDPRVVDAYVTRLRRKLAEGWADEPAAWEIVTVWGVGYRLRPRAPAERR